MGWKKISSNLVYKNNFIQLFDEEVIAPTGIKVNYGRVNFKKIAASVIIFDSVKKSILLVGQYRYPNAFYSWETIQGGSEKKESPYNIAIREMEEEAKLTTTKLEKICITNTSNSVTDETAHLFFCDFANTFEYKKATADLTEKLELKWFPLDKALKMINEGDIRDSLTQISIFHLSNALKSG